VLIWIYLENKGISMSKNKLLEMWSKIQKDSMDFFFILLMFLGYLIYFFDSILGAGMIGWVFSIYFNDQIKLVIQFLKECYHRPRGALYIFIFALAGFLLLINNIGFFIGIAIGVAFKNTLPSSSNEE